MGEDLKEYLVGVRRYFHQYPEVSMMEFETASRIESELDSLGVFHKRVGETGVFAVVKGEIKCDSLVGPVMV